MRYVTLTLLGQPVLTLTRGTSDDPDVEDVWELLNPLAWSHPFPNKEPLPAAPRSGVDRTEAERKRREHPRR